jgi:hypothetical protein
MHQYRVTKYDPALRNGSGAYTKNGWTSYSDVGRSAGGVTLSKEDYLRVESAYIDIAQKFIAEDGGHRLRAVGVENRADSAEAPSEGSLISERDLPAVCRSILREEFWCRLEADDHFLHFGYDFYMYVGVKCECIASIAAAEARGLFVEQFNSPYFETKQKESNQAPEPTAPSGRGSA